MTTGRGREARIRSEYQDRYPQVRTADWEPVEAVLQQIGHGSEDERARLRLNPASRLLSDEHFEFRGISPRPEGSDPELSRANDEEARHQRLAGLQGELDAEQDHFTAREREADQTIARAEHLRERADALQRDFERLRERTAQLEFRQDFPQEEEDSHPTPPPPDQG
jgi:hypothetical protein